MNNLKSGKNSSLLHLQARLRNPKRRHAAIYGFRQGAHEKEYFTWYKKLFPYKTSLNDFHGPAFPKSCKSMFSNSAPKQAAGAMKEILWAIARSQQFAKEIKEFQFQKRLFEDALIGERYTDATEILDKIEEVNGKSIWLYQNRLAASYISKDEDEPNRISVKISNELNGHEILHFLFYYISRRCEGVGLREKLREELSDKVKNSTYLKYLQAKVFDFTNSAELAVSSLLFIDSQSSLIDHYESLIQSIKGAISDEMIPNQMISVITQALNQLHRETDDPRLLGPLGILGVVRDERTSDYACARAQAIESYTDKNYFLCKIICVDLLTQRPTDSALRLLKIKSIIELGENFQQTKNLIGEIEEHFFNLLSASEKFYSSAHAVLVLADRFCDHEWMMHFRVSLMYEIGAEENARVQRWMRDIYVRDQFSSPIKAFCCVSQCAETFINQLEEHGLYPKTLALVKSALQNEVVDNRNEDLRLCRYLAREEMVNGNYEAATYLYRNSALTEKRPALRLRSFGGAALALIHDGNYAGAVEVAIDAYLECPNAPTILPIEKLVEAIPDMELWPNTPKLGLLLTLCQQFSEDNDLSDQRLAFEKFCQDNKIEKPSDLWERAEEFGVDCVIQYLSFVWVPETMRQTLIYTSEDLIEEARIEVLKILVKVDLERSRTHQEELASRIKQQEISKTTALVEQSKVYVDIESIKKSLRIRLTNSYARYKGSLTHYGKPQDQILKQFENILMELEGEVSLPVFLSNLHLVGGKPSTTDLQFDAIFTEIAKGFLSGDHGLNAYLSTRVRHGKLVDALRKSVMDEDLVTPETIPGSYAINNYWKKQIPTNYQTAVLTVLEDFTRNYDNSLFFVRDKILQIQTYIDLQKSKDDNAEGLFKYQFSQLERRHVQSYDAEFDDIDELIIKCVDTLWEKTDANLIDVREYLSESLRLELMSHFDHLASEINKIVGKSNASSLFNAIAKARTATQQALDNVVGWFNRSEVYDRKDFEVDFPPQIAAIMVNRVVSMSSPWTGPRLSIDSSDSNLPGRSLDTLVDIFYVLFENAVKYAQAHNIPIEVDLKLRYKNGEFSGEVMSKALAPTLENLERLSQIRGTLATQESRRLAQSEGRSGFRKIHNALDSPLYKSQRLNFEHQLEGIFKVEFSFRISETQ